MLRGLTRVLVAAIQGISLVIVWAPNIQAASSSLVIYQLQTGASGAATQEYISLYNNQPVPVDVTGWCVTKSSSSDISQSQLGCLVASEPNTKLLLTSYAIVTFASSEFVSAHAGFVPDIVFRADLAASSGHIRILDDKKQEIDKLGWGAALHPETVGATAHVTGKILERQIALGPELKDTDDNAADFAQISLSASLSSSALYEEEVPTDVCANIEGLQITPPPNYLFDQVGNCRQDVCLNIDLLQIDVPDGFSVLSGDCSAIPPENATLVITELLPNVTSYDTGKEFVEIFNPNAKDVSLAGYQLQLGPSFDKSYGLPDQTISSGTYMAFSDAITQIVLSNTSATLRLVAPDGSVVSISDMYLSPIEDQAWALTGTSWQYTNQPTPGAANVMNQETAPESDEEVRSLASCPTGQYRSNETSKCRLLQTTVSSLTPCKVGQERNPATNRCRSTVLGALTSLIACKEGQERNPVTNRCRTIASASLAPCGEGQERNTETNRCRKTGSATASTQAKVQDITTVSSGTTVRWWLVGAAALLALGYAGYEWRRDVANIFHKYRLKRSQN